MSEALAVLAAHVKTRKTTPAQQVQLVLGYLVIRVLFPEITLASYLERSDALAGATDENRLFPKDALDHWCPNKGSVWSPKDRLKYMGTYVDYCDNARTTGETAVSFNDFLQLVLGDLPAGSPPPSPAAADPPPAAATAPAEPSLAPPTGAVTLPPGFVPAAPEEIPSNPGNPCPITLKRADVAKIAEYFSLPSSVGGVPVGDTLWGHIEETPQGQLRIEVINSEPRPGIDMYLVRNGAVYAELPPNNTAESIVGQYTLLIPNEPALLIDIKST
jgi:hypothetical protein